MTVKSIHTEAIACL